jgi:hypothetical protein
MSNDAPKKSTGIWFAVAVAAVLGLWFGGNELYTRLVILRRELPRLEPGEVSLIGLKVPGYHIVVSNGIARLTVGEPSEFGRPESLDSGSGTTIPMKGLIGTLRFDPEAAEELVAAMNGIDYEILPLENRVWTTDRIEAALTSGKDREKLEYDLATTLGGRGIERVNWDRLTTGIWIEVPVPLAVPAAGGTQEVVARVRIPFKTRIANSAYTYFRGVLERGGLGEDLTPTSATISGVYNQALDDAERLGAEDVGAALRRVYSEERLSALAEPVLKVLNEVEVLVTEATIADAELNATPREDSKGDTYSIRLETSGDSRDRLWQYTYRRPGSQLLLISNGVAIAAPVVRHQIKYSTVEITGIGDKKLAEEALRFIENSSKNKS